MRTQRLTATAAGLALTSALLATVPVAVPSAYAADAVAGGQTSGDVLFPHIGNSGYDARHYDVDLAWTPGASLATSTIDATTTITAVTTGAPLSSYSLDLEGLTVSAVTVDGVDADFVRDVDAAANRYKLVITPVAPVSGTFTTVVTYSGVPESHTDADGSSEGWNVTSDGATFLNQPVGSMTGFPNNNTPSDKATYTFSIDVPSDLTAVSNGELVRQQHSGPGRTTWVWDETKPMASELSLISIGDYDLHSSQITLASGRTIPEWTFVDPTSSAADRATTQATRAQLKTVLDFLEARYGPYPGDSVGLVTDVVPDGINYALETQDRPFFPDAADLDTTVHELTHQWFGDSVSPRVWNDIWLNEGPATWTATSYDADTAATYYQLWSSTPASSARWSVPPAGMTDSADLFGWQVYNRGAMTLEALRTAIGPAPYATLMRRYQATYAGTSPGTAAFIALAQQVSGRDLTAFFQDWIYDADKPAWPSPPAPPAPAGPPVSVPAAPGPQSAVPAPRVRAKGALVVGAKARVAVTRVAPGATLSYRWTVGGRTVKTSPTPSLRLKGVWTGKQVKVSVTAAEPGRSSTTVRLVLGRVR